MVTKEEVRDNLKEVIDPELDVNIVDLGLVYEIEVDENSVRILMTLTSKGCPLHGVIKEMVKREVRKIEDVEEIEFELTFDPPWSPEKMTDEGRDKVGNIPGFHAF